jgi:hypothetical protein
VGYGGARGPGNAFDLSVLRLFRGDLKNGSSDFLVQQNRDKSS